MGSEPEFDTFDKAAAASVIRAFIEEGQPHVEGSDFDGFLPDEVTALLVLAGLEDEVVPEPEPEVDEGPVDRGLFRRLVDFAKGHGFSG
jgi:hypothetical protein